MKPVTSEPQANCEHSPFLKSTFPSVVLKLFELFVVDGFSEGLDIGLYVDGALEGLDTGTLDLVEPGVTFAVVLGAGVTFVVVLDT